MNKFISITVALLLVCASAVGQEFSKQAAAPNAGDLWVQNSKGGYTIEFVNASEVAGLQFDLHDKNLKEGVYNCGGTLDSNFQVACTLHAKEGFLRVIVFAMDASPVPDATVISVNGGGSSVSKYSARAAAPSLRGVIFSDSQGRNITSSHLGK